MAKTQVLFFLGLLCSTALFGQNAFFEAHKLNRAYKAGDYRTFFQVLANQPDLVQQLDVTRGEAVSYGDVYAFYANVNFLKSSLDSMRNLKNNELKKLKSSVVQLQVKKTELVSTLENSLQKEYNYFSALRDRLIFLQNRHKEKEIEDPAAFVQLKAALEKALLRMVIINVQQVRESDEEALRTYTVKVEAGQEVDPNTPALPGQLISPTDTAGAENQTNNPFLPDSPWFSQLQPAFLTFIEQQLVPLNTGLGQLTAYRQKVGNLSRGTKVGISSAKGNSFFPQGSVSIDWGRFGSLSDTLAAVNERIRLAEAEKARKEQEQARGLESKNSAADTLTAEPIPDSNPIYYVPQVIERTAPTTIIVSGGPSSSFESSLLDATAGFIAERMKEELNVAFFEKFIAVLEKPAIKALFPTTRDLLNATESYNYSVMIQLIKEAFEKDLKALPFNAPQLMRSYPNTVVNSQDAAYIMLTGQILAKAVKGAQPIEILNFVSQNDDKLLPAQFQQAFQFLDIVSNSLRDTSITNTAWVSPQSFAALARDRDLRRFYLGLLYKEMYDFAVKNKIVANSSALASFDDINRFYGLIGEFGKMVNGLQDQLKYLKSRRASKGALELNELVPFYRSILRVVDFSVAAYLGEPSASFERFVNINDRLLDVYTSAVQRNYSGALVGALDLLRLGLGDKLKEHSELLRYGSFMVALAKAEDARQIQSVIRSMALPVGSYGIKRRNFFNISFNAYPGFTNGMELAFNSDSQRIAYNAGFTAPLGLSFSWGYRQKTERKGWRPGERLVPFPKEEVDPNLRWQVIDSAGTLGGSQLNDSIGVIRRIDTITFSTFKEVRTRVDTFNARTDRYTGLLLDTLYLHEDPRITKRQARIRRATKYRDRNGFHKYLTGSSGSIFVSVIDLGALVLFRLDDATDPLPSEVSFRQVFAPGIFYAHGFRDVPISLLVGTQLSPELRKFGDQKASAIRFNLGLTVDIPIFNFYTRTER